MLRVVRCSFAATSVGKLAIFAGGTLSASGDPDSDVVEIYNSAPAPATTAPATTAPATTAVISAGVLYLPICLTTYSYYCILLLLIMLLA
jgi:hypothetical protein